MTLRQRRAAVLGLLAILDDLDDDIRSQQRAAADLAHLVHASELRVDGQIRQLTERLNSMTTQLDQAVTDLGTIKSQLTAALSDAANVRDAVTATLATVATLTARVAELETQATANQVDPALLSAIADIKDTTATLETQLKTTAGMVPDPEKPVSDDSLD